MDRTLFEPIRFTRAEKQALAARLGRAWEAQAAVPKARRTNGRLRRGAALVLAAGLLTFGVGAACLTPRLWTGDGGGYILVENDRALMDLMWASRLSAEERLAVWDRRGELRVSDFARDLDRYVEELPARRASWRNDSGTVLCFAGDDLRAMPETAPLLPLDLAALEADYQPVPGAQSARLDWSGGWDDLSFYAEGIYTARDGSGHFLFRYESWSGYTAPTSYVITEGVDRAEVHRSPQGIDFLVAQTDDATQACAEIQGQWLFLAGYGLTWEQLLHVVDGLALFPPSEGPH